MNRILYTAGVFYAGMVGFTSCSDTNSQNTGSVSTAVFQPAQTDTCLNKFCSDFRNGEFTGQISYDLAAEMSRLYNADAGKDLVCNGSSITRIEDASSVVFDLETLKNYIWYIERNVCARGCDKKKVQLGIRFYYAKYPAAKRMQQSEQLKMLDISYANKHTLFMVPVYRSLEKKGGLYKNFNPLASYACSFKWDAVDSVAVPVNIALGGMEPDQENHGSLRPPPAGSGVFPND